MTEAKTLEAAKERWKEGKDAQSEQHARMREDLIFSNPSNPQQWDAEALKARKGRPCLTFDRTNQYISQIVNDNRQNKPAIHVLPVDSNADIAVAEKLNGIIRHIEYTSRAGIAYDYALESAARCGIGWLRVVPEITNPETNEQEIRIRRVHDVFSVILDPQSTEPDGMDSTWGMIETLYQKKAFERNWPKAKLDSFDGEGWVSDGGVRVCEEFVVSEKQANYITIDMGAGRQNLREDDYWTLCEQVGFNIPVIATFQAAIKTQKWRTFSGSEVLEETDFPSRFVPLIPIIGHEVWVDGKRYICGMTRRMMDSARAYNYERSAYIEAVALQPKAPFIASAEAIEGWEADWARSNSGNPAYLPFNAFDDQQRALPMPSRQSPPAFPVAFAQGGQIASADMEAAIGMFKSNLGQQDNANSGKAILARERQGDTANFHYTDNLSRSIEQLGRVILDMIPRIYDTPRQARIVGEDGTHEMVQIDPAMPQATAMRGQKVVAINPGVGTYDVRVKAGPSFASLREESAAQLAQLLQAAPQLVPILGDAWVRMQDWPEAEKISQRLKAMLPPEIKALEQDEDEDPTQRLMQQAQQMGQQIQAMEQAGMQLQEQLKQAQEQIQAHGGQLQSAEKQVMQETAKRMKAELDAQRISALAAIEKAQEELRDLQEGQSEQGQPMQKMHQSQPMQPMQPMVLPDVNGALVGALAPMMEGVMASTQGTEQALSMLAQSQAQLSGDLARGQEMVAAMLAQLAAPKQASIKIEKQKDGSFVGTKVEQ